MKTHLSFPTRDINASVKFYRVLLDSEPAKHYHDYALFLSDDPGLELALELDPSTKGESHAHYGLAVETPSLVNSAIERFKSAGLEVDIETEEVCCYAQQDKVWITDPDGRRWETYYVIAETEERDGDGDSCCGGPAEQPSLVGRDS